MVKHPRQRKPGRPRRTEDERATAKERRIEPSYKGRLTFRPGDKHALDSQIKEARNYRGLLMAQLEQLHLVQDELVTLDDPGAFISREENVLKEFLWETYRDHKHRDHITATFLSIRRQRLLARLQAATDAIQIAADLLQPDDTLLDDLRRAVEQQHQEAEQRALQAKTQHPLPPAPPSEEGPQINSRHIYGDLQKSRAQLARFEAQIGVMRDGISPAVGWFETYYVSKERYTAAARAYLKRNKPIPDDVPITEEVWYGPYLKYRWQEIGGGPMYTVQMSLIPEEERGSAATWATLLDVGDDAVQGESAPWSSL